MFSIASLPWTYLTRNHKWTREEIYRYYALGIMQGMCAFMGNYRCHPIPFAHFSELVTCIKIGCHLTVTLLPIKPISATDISSMMCLKRTSASKFIERSFRFVATRSREKGTVMTYTLTNK